MHSDINLKSQFGLNCLLDWKWIFLLNSLIPWNCVFPVKWVNYLEICDSNNSKCFERTLFFRIALQDKIYLIVKNWRRPTLDVIKDIIPQFATFPHTLLHVPITCSMSTPLPLPHACTSLLKWPIRLAYTHPFPHGLNLIGNNLKICKIYFLKYIVSTMVLRTFLKKNHLCCKRQNMKYLLFCGWMDCIETINHDI